MMPSKERIEEFAESFKTMDETERRKAILGTTLTLMGLATVKKDIEQLQVEVAASSAQSAVTQLLLAHITNLTDSLMQGLTVLTELSPADAIFVSQLVVIVFNGRPDVPA
jgi:hypothetical protein